MTDKILVRIEYNEKEGDFHFEQNLNSKQNDNGYQTIDDEIDSSLAFEFGEKMDEKYPAFTNEDKNYPSFAQMKTEFQRFIVDNASNLR